MMFYRKASKLESKNTKPNTFGGEFVNSAFYSESNACETCEIQKSVQVTNVTVSVL